MRSQRTMRMVHEAWPESHEPSAADFSGMDGKVVVDGRRNLRHEAKKGVELHVLGG